MGLALASGRSVLELAGIGSAGHGGSFWQLLTEATPVATLTTRNLVTQTQYACLTGFLQPLLYRTPLLHKTTTMGVLADSRLSVS